jgi:hypothetical protein
MSAHTINQLATWMIEHPCIDSEVLEGREDDSGHSSGSEILLSRAQVTDSSVLTTFSKIPCTHFSRENYDKKLGDVACLS